jgi:hypothetical protein
MRRVVVALAIAVSTSLLTLGAPGAVANAPKPGQTCPKAGLIWEVKGMKLKCVKKGKKLVWQKVKGGGSDSGGDYGSQPVPADGKWKVPPGYPDDLPPVGWRGEPAWFISNWDVPTAQKVGPACAQYPLTHLVTDLDSLDSITPQGFMQPGAHAMPVPHMYYNTGEPTGSIKDPNGVPYRSEIVDVYAPADMVLRGLVRQEIQREGARYAETMMAFSVCDRLWFFTAHIDNVPAEFTAAAKASPRQRCQQAGQTADTQDCFYEYLRLPVAAGTKIGTSSGRAHGFDFGFTDATKPVAGKLDPGAFSPRWAAGVCHVEYYAPDLRSRIQAKVDGDNGCGQLVSDVAGTASGMWLAEGKRQMSQVEDYHIALAKHWADKGKWGVSIGNYAEIPGVPSGFYELTPASSGNNRAFSLVKPGEVVCYDRLVLRRGMVPGPTIYLSMTTGSMEKLQIVGTTGACPSGSLAMPSGAKTFERRNTLG